MRSLQHLALLTLRLAFSLVIVSVLLGGVRSTFTPLTVVLPGTASAVGSTPPATTGSFHLAEVPSYVRQVTRGVEQLRDALALGHP